MEDNAPSEEKIRADIEEYKNEALNTYQSFVEQITNINETEDLIKLLFEIKLKTIDKYNEIFKLHPDTFNNSEYFSYYKDAKHEIEDEIDNFETQAIKQNNSKCESYNKELIKKLYENIQENINNNAYDSKNCDEYVKDYQEFLSNYNEQSKGESKLEILIEFIKTSKEEFIKSFSDKLVSENKEKLKQINEQLEKSNKDKAKLEDECKNLNDKNEENFKKIENLNSNIEKKKREIKDLNEDIRQIEEQIKKEREEDGMQESSMNNISNTHNSKVNNQNKYGGESKKNKGRMNDDEEDEE